MGKGRVEEWRREEERVGGGGEVEGGRLYHCVRPGLFHGLPPDYEGVADLPVEGAGVVGGRF